MSAPSLSLSPSANPPRSIILLVNILSPEHTPLSPAEALVQVDDPEARMTTPVERIVDVHALEPRDWRAIAASLDDLVDEAKHLARAVEGPKQYVVMGRAPLPVFAYLGLSMQRIGAPKLFINQIPRTGHWDHVVLPPTLTDTPDAPVFATTHPTFGRDRDGRIALGVQCFPKYGYDEEQVATLVEQDGGDLLGTVLVQRNPSQAERWLTPGDLGELLRHVEGSLDLIARERIECCGYVLALAGPAWVAFWIGHQLNPHVVDRIDLLNWIPGSPRYTPALAWPLRHARWFAGRAKLLFIAAEPEDQVRTSASRALQQVRDTVGSGTHYALDFDGAGRADALSLLLRERRPDILHLWLHGDADGNVYLERSDGETALVPGADFVGLVQRSGARPTIILVCACFLGSLVDDLLGVAECVVGMAGEVDNEAARAFAIEFYRQLAAGQSVADAFAEGKLQANLTVRTPPGTIRIAYRDSMQGGRVLLFPR